MIRKMIQLTSTALVITALFALPGCGGSKPPDSKPASEHHEGDGHDHSKDKTDDSGHDHEKEGEHK